MNLYGINRRFPSINFVAGSPVAICQSILCPTYAAAPRSENFPGRRGRASRKGDGGQASLAAGRTAMVTFCGDWL